MFRRPPVDENIPAPTTQRREPLKDADAPLLYIIIQPIRDGAWAPKLPLKLPEG